VRAAALKKTTLKNAHTKISASKIDFAKSSKFIIPTDDNEERFINTTYLKKVCHNYIDDI